PFSEPLITASLVTLSPLVRKKYWVRSFELSENSLPGGFTPKTIMSSKCFESFVYHFNCNPRRHPSRATANASNLVFRAFLTISAGSCGKVISCFFFIVYFLLKHTLLMFV